MAVSLRDSRELKALTNYAVEKLRETERLSKNVAQMGGWKRFCDSKVPERDRTWYHFFSLKTSSKEGMLSDIRKYKEFYEKLNDALHGIIDLGEDGAEDPRKIISDLLKYLSKMSEVAEHGSYTTGSSTVYDLHNSFIAKHEKLEYMIKNVESLALNEMLTREEEKRRELMEGLQRSKEYIDTLTERFINLQEKYDEMCGNFSVLMQRHEELLTNQGNAIKENEGKQQQLIDLIKELMLKD